MKPRLELNVICVDDERSALINCRFALNQISDIVSANYFMTAGEAVAYVADHPIDVAFLDIDLPEVSGFELAEQLTILCPTIKVIFVTGNIRYMDKANRKVDVPYVFKPYANDEIKQALEQLKL